MEGFEAKIFGNIFQDNKPLLNRLFLVVLWNRISRFLACSWLPLALQKYKIWFTWPIDIDLAGDAAMICSFDMAMALFSKSKALVTLGTTVSLNSFPFTNRVFGSKPVVSYS